MQGGGGLGTRMPFVQEKDSTSSRWGHARKISSTQIDDSLVKNWLQLCERHHGKSCTLPLQTTEEMQSLLTSPTRVIDVEKHCIVDTERDCRYVALSYVWGQVSTLRLLKSNKVTMMTPDSLASMRQDIPRTISDAIDLVSRIGERYLWVDTLCLIQDDNDDMSIGIQTMDLIYERSHFTIIAGSGVDANAGLPGVRPNSRNIRQVIDQVNPGNKMTVLYELDDYLKPSKYASRGWT
jgi:hypothetical protein